MEKTWSPFLREVRFQKLQGALWCCATVLLIISLTISISLALWELLYFTLRYSPWGDTSDTTTVAVPTRGVPLLIWKNIHNFSFITFFFFFGGGGFFIIFAYCIQHCFICRPTDSTVPTDAGIEPRTVVTGALPVRRSNHKARSHPPQG